MTIAMAALPAAPLAVPPCTVRQPPANPMMKRNPSVFLFAVLAMLAAPAPADAQLARFGVGVGPSAPVGDLGNVANTGVHAQAMLALRLPLLPVSLRGDVLYQRLPVADQDDFQQIAGVVNGFFSLLPLPMIDPYISAGVGVYNSDFGGNIGSSTDVGVNAGVGLRVNLLFLEPFAEVRYHHVLGGAGSPRTLPVTIGVIF
jgi:hypothetical protein